MRRIFSAYAYGPGPRTNCWWDETIAAPTWPELSEPTRADVAIIGGGFTGLTAAHHLAEQGAEVVLLEAETPGWGASGRNGGFCCTGGTKLNTQAMQRRYGSAATAEYEAGEIAAVELVRDFLTQHNIDADIHSNGETVMAHSQRALKALRREAESLQAQGAECEFIPQSDLASQGLNGAFFGAMTTPVGFGLNPRKYLVGRATVAQAAGARLYQRTAAQSIRFENDKWHISTPKGHVTATQVILATNGYSSENVPTWLAGRYMPAQSTVMVTRPITPTEQAAQGWSSAQMAYDTRNLLHYFRLMPDGRFLFGMRGGLRASPNAESAIRATLRRHFDDLFPAWSQIESTHYWSGMVCMSRDLVPFVGTVPEQKGLFAGLCYHGNGVAMGSYAGRLLADLVQGKTPERPYSKVMQRLNKFPLGRARRLLMPPAYAALGLMD